MGSKEVGGSGRNGGEETGDEYDENKLFKSFKELIKIKFLKKNKV